MSTKKKSGKMANPKLILLLSAAAALIVAFTFCSKELIPQADADPSEVFVVVEEMPRYPGGDMELMKFMAMNVNYPEAARTDSIQGTVMIKFCITNIGSVDQITVVRGVNPLLDNEATRVAALLPLWTPGRQGGKPVNVWYTLPVKFQLR